MIVKEFRVNCQCGLYKRVEADSESAAKNKFREAGWRYGGMLDPNWYCPRHAPPREETHD